MLHNVISVAHVFLATGYALLVLEAFFRWRGWTGAV